MNISSKRSQVEQDNWLRSLGERFALSGKFETSFAIEVGHINSTYKVEYLEASGSLRSYVFQKINENVFPEPSVVMENVSVVTEHIRKGCADATEQALQLFPSLEGMPYMIDPEGAYWRCYNFIEDAYSVDVVENEEQAYAAAKSFGIFLEKVSDLDPTQLNEVILDFHHTPKRLEALKDAIQSDLVGREADVSDEIQFILSRQELCHSLQRLKNENLVPERVTHNDTKINNVMLSRSTNEGICVIDLDTVMPGLSLYDFGDLVRTSVSSSAEDETDLSKIEVRMPIFKALTRGFLEGCPSLTHTEKENLVLSAKVITLEIAMRFLTDYLKGDIYFKINSSVHNLDRCRAQLQLIRILESKDESMKAFVSELSS